MSQLGFFESESHILVEDETGSIRYYRDVVTPLRRSLDIDLEPGSLLVMSYETQRRYDHGVPKTHEPVGPRISLAFRARSLP